MGVAIRRGLVALFISVLAVTGVGLVTAPAQARPVGIPSGAYTLVVRTPTIPAEAVTRDPAWVRGGVLTVVSGRTKVHYRIHNLRNGGQVDPHNVVRWTFFKGRHGWYSGPQYLAGIQLGRTTLIPR